MLMDLVQYLNSVLDPRLPPSDRLHLVYDFPMAALGRFVEKHGLRAGYLSSIVFSAIPYYA